MSDEQPIDKSLCHLGKSLPPKQAVVQTPKSAMKKLKIDNIAINQCNLNEKPSRMTQPPVNVTGNEPFVDMLQLGSRYKSDIAEISVVKEKKRKLELTLELKGGEKPISSEPIG